MISNDLKQWKLDRSTRKQENAFWANRWKFAKSICEGSNNTKPSFSSECGLAYFKSTFSQMPDDYQDLPNWADQILPEIYNVAFDMSPITPKIVRKILKGTNKSSSPGEDCITYCHLWKLPSTHHYLATLFSKILLHSHSAPPQWCSGIMKLIYKTGSSDDPKNFRPIALTSWVGKLFHKILTIRLETFLLHNHLIDPSIQKGFLRNCPGTYEHIFALNCILDHAQQIGSPTMITFLDLKNAFGSVPHRLVFNILQRIQIPSDVISYIRSCYNQLTACIVTDKWSTPRFTIQKGVFQGDTLSPTIFLAAFTPIILRTQQSEYPGCQIAIPIPGLENLPPVNSTLYVKWDEESEEEKGWYRCLVTEHHLDGSTSLEYTDGQTEKVNLRSCDWIFAKKKQQEIRILGCPPTSRTNQTPLQTAVCQESRAQM